MSADVDAIVSGAVAREVALWQLGCELLGHTSDMLDIRSGATGYGPEAGARSTDSDLWLWYHHSKGVRIEQMTWRAPTTPDEERIADVLTREGDTDRLIPSSEEIGRAHV